MHRTYLIVPPEERSEVEALGARLDPMTQRWFVIGEPSSSLARWCPIFDGDGDGDGDDEEEGEDDEYCIISAGAYVAVASISCPHCGQETEVICIHCSNGVVRGEQLERFTVSDIWAMDQGLLQALERWPRFRQATEDDVLGDFTNHCAACAEPISDLILHSEPDHAFFDVVHAEQSAVTLISLPGTFRLGGCEHFLVE